MICQHQFIRIIEVDKPYPSVHSDIPTRAIPGIIAGCALCGEVRNVWSNGQIEIRVPGKE